MAQNGWVIGYYGRRAERIEAAYRGEPPAWVREMVADMQAALRGRRVLEVACGTGHWTCFAAEVAAHVTGVDAAPAMLDLARAKNCDVTFLQGDAFRLDDLPGVYDAGLAMQWFSHIPRQRTGEFLTAWHRRIGPGAPVFLADNRATPYTTAYRKIGTDDTFEARELDGEYFEVLKNYYSADELRSILGPYAVDVAVHEGVRWWWLSYRVRG